MTLFKRFVAAGALAAGLVLPALAQPAQAQAPQRDGPVLQDVILGDPNAPVTIVEYASLTCPHCASFHQETLPKLKEAYIDTGKVNLVFRDFPFESVGMRAAMLARCAGPQRYHGFLAVLFRQQRTWAGAENPTAALLRLARLSGMSEADFNACLQNQEVETAVLQSRMAGQQQGVDSTPTFFIGDTRLNGAQPFEEFQRALRPLLPAGASLPAVVGSAQAQEPPPPPPPDAGPDGIVRPQLDQPVVTTPEAVPQESPAPAADEAGPWGWLGLLILAVVIAVAIGMWLRRRQRP